jgi:hypothetical protein
MGKQIVVCHLPVPHLGTKTAVSPVLFLPEGKKDVTPRIGPRKGDPCSVLRASIPRRGPSRHPLVTISETNHSIFVNFEELSAPLISAVRRPAPRPPFGDGSCWPESPTLGPCHRPSYNPLTIHLLSLIFAWSLLRGAVCSPSSKAGDPRATHPCPPFGDIIR